MPVWTALALATPLFGFSLHVSPDVLTLPAEVLVAAQRVDAPWAGTAPAEVAAVQAAAALPPEVIAAQMDQRARLAKVHRIMGITTWSAMTVTVVLGFIQYYNLYGTFSSLGDTPCVKGTAVFGQRQCRGQPIPHLVSAGVTSALYFTTYGLALAMPDPLHLDEGNSAFAKRLRLHKRLRWVHLSGMIAQLLLGVFVANAEHFGFDRANHYRGLRALATVHLGIGLVTYGALTWAGALYVKQ